MNIQKNGTSIFAIIAFISFIISVWINLSSISNNINNIISATLPLGHLNAIIFIFLMVIGIRLYLHGWMIDETFLIDRIMHQNKNIPLKIFELIIRFNWLSLTVFLPFFLKETTINLNGIDISWDLYLAILFGFLLIWGLTLKKKILEQAVIGYEENLKTQIQQKLKSTIFKQDIVFFIIFLVNYLMWNFVPDTISLDISNWRIIILVVSIGYVIGYSFTQIVTFIGEISKSKIEISFSRK